MTAHETAGPPSFDRGAAITRSLLGWGVVAGPFYLVPGLAQAMTRHGFDPTRHALSHLLLGDWGWVQATNLVLTGVMVIAAAVGFHRLSAHRWISLPLGLFGLGMVASAVLPPDPAQGFPPGSEGVTEATATGLAHLAFGAIGLVGLAVAAGATARWFADRAEHDAARLSRLAAILVVAGFVAGAALATSSVGVVALWVAVVAGFTWLLVASLRAYRLAPHPDGPTA